MMTARYPSADIERAVDELSERLFQKPKGNVFLSMICGRMPFLFRWRHSISSVNWSSVHIQNAPFHIGIHHHRSLFSSILSRNYYSLSVSYGSAIAPSSFSGNRLQCHQFVSFSCHICSTTSRVIRNRNRLRRRILDSVQSATVMWMTTAFTVTSVESVWWWFVLQCLLIGSMIIIVSGSTTVSALAICGYVIVSPLILVLHPLSFLHFCVHGHQWCCCVPVRGRCKTHCRGSFQSLRP